jgi:hypothetical protein
LSFKLLAAKTHGAILAAARFKPLQTDNQNTRHSEDFERLRGLNVVLALVAVPLVVLVKQFSLAEFSEAVSQLDVRTSLLSMLHWFDLKFGGGHQK